LVINGWVIGHHPFSSNLYGWSSTNHKPIKGWKEWDDDGIDPKVKIG
jgi:hypothetical protein